jgi:glycosyltransferase involved in cell wall biosynthesis
VIVPTLNEDRNIESCLASIKRQKYPNFEIILVDGDSSDKTVEIAKKYVDKILVKKDNGPGQARNLGVINTDAEIVAFTDADTEVSPNWLDIIARNFSDPEVVGVGGISKPKNPRIIDKIMFKMNLEWFCRLSARFGFYQFLTLNCAYRRDVFLKAGGFDESLSMLEDIELSLRMRRFGKLIFDKRLCVYTSIRRVEQEGYLKVFVRNLKGFINLLLGREIKEEYFSTIEH